MGKMKIWRRNSLIFPGETEILPGEFEILPGETEILPGELEILPGETEILPGGFEVLPGEPGILPGECWSRPGEFGILPGESWPLPGEWVAARENFGPSLMVFRGGLPDRLDRLHYFVHFTELGASHCEGRWQPS